MMTWLLRLLAVLLVCGAVLAGYMGYRLSTAKPPAAGGAAGQAQTAPDQPSVQLAHSTRALRAGEVLAADMIALRAVPEPAPVGSFRSLESLRGRVIARDLPAGAPLVANALMAPTSPLQLGLRHGERAVAIKVDELIGLGGFAQAGDLVDVLLYLRPSRETGETSSAQVVLAGARVLAYGDMVTSAEPDAAPDASDAGVLPPRGGSTGGSKMNKDERAKAKASTSAVLAVAENEVSRLMLASSSGVLRLALHPPAPERLSIGVEPIAETYFVRLGELLPAAPGEPKPSVAAPSRVPAMRAAPAPAPAPAVVIHEGEKTRTAEAVPR